MTTGNVLLLLAGLWAIFGRPIVWEAGDMVFGLLMLGAVLLYAIGSAIVGAVSDTRAARRRDQETLADVTAQHADCPCLGSPEWTRCAVGRTLEELTTPR